LNCYIYVTIKSDLWEILSLIRKYCVLELAYRHGIKSAVRILKKMVKTLESKINLIKIF